jgi:Malic enzyme, NAD binding domain
MRANIAQTAQVFPGIGLGAIMSRTTRIRDEMVIAAAQVRSWPYAGDVWTLHPCNLKGDALLNADMRKCGRHGAEQPGELKSHPCRNLCASRGQYSPVGHRRPWRAW